MATFRFAPDILRRLGEELNPSLEHGVIELVKNARDADARNCTVRLSRVTTAGGAIQVTDDGDGMTADELVDGFLLLGRSPKVGRGRTRRGRVLAGSKGLGRLAALRAGTVPRSERDRGPSQTGNTRSSLGGLTSTASQQSKVSILRLKRLIASQARGTGPTSTSAD